jgi:hypothetical protein
MNKYIRRKFEVNHTWPQSNIKTINWFNLKMEMHCPIKGYKGSVKLTSHVHLERKLRINGALPPIGKKKKKLYMTLCLIKQKTILLLYYKNRSTRSSSGIRFLVVDITV